MPLFAGRGQAGLFPGTPAGRAAADRACAEQLVEMVGGELWAASQRGLDQLLAECDPRELFEDCVRAIEARQEQLEDVRATVSRIHANLDGLRAAVERLLPVLRPSPRDAHTVDRAVELALSRWQAEAGEDCPLPELFRQVELVRSELTAGEFHDALRRLHAAGRIYLHAWTGPLETMPEPAYAVLIGHDVAYYASGRPDGGPRTPSAALAEAR
jgi:hypothetical protein